MTFHEKIEAVRKKMGKDLLILGHHYQNEAVIKHTDLRGDSFQLSAAAAENSDCKTIVFCGVHFMAETADILANSREKLRMRNGRRVDVILPDLQAGCSMADMATRHDVEKCWKELSSIIDVDDMAPVTYVNSTADLKAFCGHNGGISCTSTNARAVLDWALARKRRVLFFPDQHLGRNTALAMGIPESEIILWDRLQPFLGGLTPELIKNSRIILWNGYCDVHQKFTTEQIEQIRKKYPGIRIIVHPECCRAVVDAADEAGSTSYILNKVNESPAGSLWTVGTEGCFVERLALTNPDKTILNLSSEPSYCETMGKIELGKLTTMLEAIEAGKPQNVIRVDDSVSNDAFICLQRMLSCQ